MFIADPRRIKEDVVAESANLIDHLTRIVDGAIVSTELNNRQAERAFFLRARRRNFSYLFAQITFFEAMGIYAANKAVGISGRFKIDRCCASLQKSTMVI